MSAPLTQSEIARCVFTKAGCIFLIALPWLNPFSPGPTPSVVPLLVSWTCAAALVLTRAPLAGAASRLALPGAVAVLFFGAAFWRTGLPPGAEVLALGMSLLAILACALRFAGADQADGRAVALAWLLAGLVSAVMGALQYTGAAQALAPWVSPANLGDAFGNLRQRNHYASLTSIALCALLWLARQDDVFRRPMPVLLPAVLLAAGNALSHSRTGLFQLLLILGLAWLWGLHRERAPRWVLAPLLPVYLLTALAMPVLIPGGAHAGIFTRLSEGAPSCASRTTLWLNVLDLIRLEPWWGWGWGRLDYAHFATLYDGPRFCDILDNAHNLPLHLAVELGLPAALFLCGAALWAVLRLRPWRETDPLRQMAWAVLAVMGLHSVLEYPLWYGPFQMAAGICLGLLVVVPQSHSRRPLAALGLTVPLTVGVGLAALDYHRARQIYLSSEERDAGYADQTLEKAREAWIFRDQVRFAELTTTTLERANAEWTLTSATSLLRFSPEPRVIEKAVESAVMLGRDDEALPLLIRFRAAFPKEHADWAGALRKPPVTPEGPD